VTGFRPLDPSSRTRTRDTSPNSGSSHGNSIPLGIRGTDLGIAFTRGETLIFLFGDTFTDTGAGWLTDSIATAAATLSEYIAYEHVPRLEWQQGADGRFAPIRLDRRTLAEFSTPVEGISLRRRIGDTTAASTFAFFVLAHLNAPQTSIVARSVGGADFEQLEEVVTQHFQFVQAQSDPDGFVYICGTGNVNEGTRQRRLSRARRTEQISGPCRLDLLAPRRMGCGRAVCAAAVQRISISPLQGRDLRPVAPDCARRTVPDAVQLRHT
jgi:hypothetical protein